MIFFRIIAMLFFLWLAGLVWFAAQIEILSKNISENADAIIVFTGAKGRIDAGLDLLATGKAKHLFVSGVGQQAILDDLSKYLQDFDLEKIQPLRENISLGHLATSTEENANETMQWVLAQRCLSVILVTSNYHMPRSLYMLKAALPNIKIIPFCIKKKSMPAMLMFKLSFIEYNKYLYYRFVPKSLKNSISGKVNS